MYIYTFSRDLGVHIDGFISIVAHTVVVGASSENKINNKRADCFVAAHFASQAALRLMRPGNDVNILYYIKLLLFMLL